MRRLFCIWNRGYKTQFIIASDVDEALAIARTSGHTRRGHRRWKDLTETAEHEFEGAGEGRTQAALNYGKAGVATLDPAHGWLIDGAPTWSEETPDG